MFISTVSLASSDQDTFVVSVTYTRACLYIALHPVAMVKMTAQRTAIPSETDLRNVASEPTLDLLESSVMRLEHLISTYTCHSHTCGLNPCSTPSCTKATQSMSNASSFLELLWQKTICQDLWRNCPLLTRSALKRAQTVPGVSRFIQSDLKDCWGSACKADLGWPSVVFAKQTFMGEKVKHRILHLKGVHLLCDHGEPWSCFLHGGFFPLSPRHKREQTHDESWWGRRSKVMKEQPDT